MSDINPKQFLQYAGVNPDRWNLIIGRNLSHPKFGKGIVTDIKIEDGEISIFLEFASEIENDLPMKKCFSTVVFGLIESLQFPDSIAQKILTNDGRSKSHVTGTRKEKRQPTFQEKNNQNENEFTSESEGKRQSITSKSGDVNKEDIPLPSFLVTSEKPNPKFSVGQNIKIKANQKKRGKIQKIRLFDPKQKQWIYEIYFSAQDVSIYTEPDLLPDEINAEWGGLDDFLRDIAILKMNHPLRDALYALNGSRTKFEVYQFKPAIKFLANPDQRLLIADEVGLGKTIEAGIIYLELQARIGLERVLVVCPSSLKQKWQDELKSRFDEEFFIYDSNSIKNFITDYNSYGDSTQLRGIVSLETIRRKDIAEALQPVKFDLVIIDEAHHCRNSTTLTHAVARVITENSDAALLLTATPLQMGQQDLFNLLNILSPGEFDNANSFLDRLEPNQFVNRSASYLAVGDQKNALIELKRVETTSQKRRYKDNPYYHQVIKILSSPYPKQQEMITAQRRLLELNTLSTVFTRTRKRDIQEKSSIRTAHTLEVAFTKEEKDFYDYVIEQVRWNYWQNHEGSGISGWVTIMRERQVASCISAYQKSHMDDLEDVLTTEEEAFENQFGDEDSEEISIKYSLHERKLLTDIFSKFKGIENPEPIKLKKVTHDSKFEVFYEALVKVLQDDPTSKILVFSFFRDTIEYLRSELLKRGIEAFAIHGGYAVPDRQKTIEIFREEPKVRILISSDVGSEGLDFQFCDTLFNYDLPWNPMKVEQRIGRLDRFGQKSDRIRIYNLVIEDTIESRILMRLYDRIEIFKQSIGDIEVILGETIREITKAVFTNKLSPDEEIEQAEKASRNILRRKQEMEEFETNKLQFLGQEAIFNTTVEQTIESGFFVSDIEIKSLINGFIKDKFNLSRLEDNKANDSTYTMFVNEDLAVYLQKFIYQQKKNDSTAQQFLTRIRAGKELPLTFSSDLAYERKLLEFITPRHPLSQAALDYWQTKKETKNRIARFNIQDNTFPEGLYYFYIFSIDSEGLDKHSRLIPVVIVAENGDVHSQFSKHFLRLVQTKAVNSNGIQKRCELEFPDEIEDSALLYMNNAREILNQQLIESNDAMVNARLFAVEQSYQAKVNRIEETRQKVTNQSILKMYEGQLRNIKAKYIAKVEEIESARKIQVSYRLGLKGCVKVVNPD